MWCHLIYLFFCDVWLYWPVVSWFPGLWRGPLSKCRGMLGWYSSSSHSYNHGEFVFVSLWSKTRMWWVTAQPTHLLNVLVTNSPAESWSNNRNLLVSLRPCSEYFECPVFHCTTLYYRAYEARSSTEKMFSPLLTAINCTPISPSFDYNLAASVDCQTLLRTPGNRLSFALKKATGDNRKVRSLLLPLTTPLLPSASFL